MKKGYSRIVVLVDESGSMLHLKNHTVEGLNNFIREQKEHPGDADFSLYFFDKYSQQSNLTHWNVLEQRPALDFNIRRTIRNKIPIGEVVEVSDYEYNPRGYTPLLDAIGLTIDEFGRELRETPEIQRPENVIVCVITDGLENASVEYSKDKIKKMIEHQRDVYKWTFVFLGANQDSFSEANKLGFDRNYVSNFSYSSQGVKYSASAASYATSAVRSGLSCNLAQDFPESKYSPKL